MSGLSRITAYAIAGRRVGVSTFSDLEGQQFGWELFAPDTGRPLLTCAPNKEFTSTQLARNAAAGAIKAIRKAVRAELRERFPEGERSAVALQIMARGQA